MYITDKYWNNYIGDTDDSLTLLEYLAGKQKEEISLEEIFSDFGLDKLQGNFRETDMPLTFTTEEDWEMEIQYAIDLITDLAALLLECRMSGSINLCELLEDDLETEFPDIRITAAPKEQEQIKQALTDFVSEPLAYDLAEMCSEEEMQEMAEVCEALRKELYGKNFS